MSKEKVDRSKSEIGDSKDDVREMTIFTMLQRAVYNRLNEFFQRIHDTGEIPTVEKMCLALGIHRQTAWQWKTGQGCSAERTYMIKKAYDIMAALDAELVSKNKIPQVTYIFRSKNYYGMSDQTQLVITPNVPFQDGNVSDVNKLVETLPDPEKTEEE